MIPLHDLLYFLLLSLCWFLLGWVGNSFEKRVPFQNSHHKRFNRLELNSKNSLRLELISKTRSILGSELNLEVAFLCIRSLV